MTEKRPGVALAFVFVFVQPEKVLDVVQYLVTFRRESILPTDMEIRIQDSKYNQSGNAHMATNKRQEIARTLSI